MGIDLGRGNIGMTQQFLDASQIGTVIQEVGGEGVAQHMRRHPPRRQPRLRRQFAQQPVEALTRQMSCPAAGGKQKT